MAQVARVTQAVILAGGVGTRLRPLTDDRPKPMILMNGRPFLEYLIEQLKENGVKEVLLLLGYLPEQITAHFGDGSRFGVRIKYSITPVEDSTGTRLKKTAPLMEDHFLLMNCDNYWNLRMEPLLAFHNEKNVLVTTVVYTNKDGITKNNVFVDDEGYITRFDPSRTSPDLNGVNLAYAVTSKDVFDLMPEEDFDYEKVIFPILIARRKLAGYRSDERHHSIGKLERLPETERFLKALDEKTKAQAIFLDRDGTIVRHTTTFVVRPSQLRLLPGVPEALRALNRLGYLLILITNQPVISRGLITPRGMAKLHRSLFTRFERRGVHFSAAYVCPHHPDGTISPYGRKCRCRKPEPGMILRAIKEMNIDPKRSFMIGDALIDVVAGKRAGVRTILVKTGPGHSRLDKLYQRTTPDLTARNLLAAAKFISRFLDGHRRA